MEKFLAAGGSIFGKAFFFPQQPSPMMTVLPRHIIWIVLRFLQPGLSGCRIRQKAERKILNR